MKIVCEETKGYLDALDKKTLSINDINEDFVVVNDDTYIKRKDLNRIVEAINKYGYKVHIEEMKEEAEIIARYGLGIFNSFDLVVSVGDGGKRFLNNLITTGLFTNKDIINLVWHREWDQNCSIGFETDIDKFDFKNKKILLVEDVVASGKSLFCVKNEIEILGGSVVGVVCGIINESSPLINKSFVDILSAKKLLASDSTLDPFWFPPIYSLRHLIYGDEEMEDVYKEMNKHYFKNENIVEKVIKEVRNEIL